MKKKENNKKSIIDSIKNAAKKIETWPKWKQDLCGIESDYTITSIDLKKINKKRDNTMQREQLAKQKSHAFDKDVYLLGANKENEWYWLEAPSWDCNWYWGFGYVTQYINNEHPTKDIISHQRIDSTLLVNCVNLFECPLLVKPTFSEKEGWELTELFTQFYLLKEMAEFTHREKPNCYISGNTSVTHENLSSWNQHINNIMIPAITKAIIDILSPNGGV